MRLFVFLILLFAGCAQSEKKSGKNLSAGSPSDLPAINVFATTGDSIRINALEGKLILVLFTPDCDHCQREATDISSHFDLFKDYKLYFIAAQTNDVLNEFAVKYDLKDRPNVVFAQGPIVPVVKILKPTSMPTILIYNENGSLVKRFDGETKVEDIEEFL